MPFLELSRVSFAHSGAVPLFDDLSLRFESGWTGVVGPNGGGKTTLLCLLAGDLEPDAGEVHRNPRGLQPRLCAQTVEIRPPAVEQLAQDGAAGRLRSQLALEPEDLERWATLSPGERKRWQMGAALHCEPGALLLDEPSNHLDAHGRRRLLEALREFPGVGVLVSHDRLLLDELTRATLRVGAGPPRLWRGVYAVARASWEREEAEELQAYQRLQGERRKERRRLADARRRTEQAEARRRRKLRRAGPKDIDTRKRLSWTRRRSAEARNARDAHLARARLGRLDESARAFDLHKALGRELFVDWQEAPVGRLFCLDCEALQAGPVVLARDVHLDVERDQRIHLQGPNGAGKTTLLEALLGAARVPRERLLYLPQAFDAAARGRLLAELLEAPGAEQGRVLAIVAALGVDPEALLLSAAPSPGEARKLALAFGLARQVWGLVLDEPTNHLDLPSIERLEAALSAYPGALVLVSHDARFAERLTARSWQLENGRLRVE